jgi:beta-1,4-mannosyl-glycoprotein beta-1,4-N-acetylglucosaminyltransferase
MFKTCSFYQSFIWAHDVLLLPYGCNLKENQILSKWNKYINGCICLTEWHRNIFIEKYPELKDKIYLINNGIDNSLFTSRINKIPNKFIYSSRPDRGLDTLIDLWPKILEKIPDATLTISSYGSFPCNQKEILLKNKIDQFVSINYLGKLNTEKLYEQIASAEYWLYPTSWPETSCITALEMLRSEVICLYYPVAGLKYTMDKYGIELIPGKEIETLVSLTNEQKQILRNNGRQYAENCSWKNRSKVWQNIIGLDDYQVSNESYDKKTENKLINKRETILFFIPIWYTTSNLIDYLDSLNTVYNVIYTNNDYYACTLNPVKVLFVFEISNKKVFDYFNKKNVEIALFNSEPLNLIHRLDNIKKYLDNNKGIKIYDYSLSNIKILNQNGYNNTYHLNYVIYKEEDDFLKNTNKTTTKIYDFGIISHENPVYVKRRLDVANFLISNNYSVNVIQGWKENRDKELAKCSVILNIHGSNNGEISMIFEHIRCDRLLSAGFKVLSEESLFLDDKFIKDNQENLKLISYNDFFNCNLYTSLNWLNQTKTNKIIDCFTFYNEINMLTYRLNALNDVVDYFILVEANQTHVGNPKPLFFDSNKHLFDKFSEKIIHIVVDLPFNESNIDISNGDQWTNEKFQRNCIKQGLDKIQCKLDDNDSIIIADVDEIPDPKIVTKMKKNIIKNEINVLEQDFYYYNLNSKKNEKWYHCKTIKYKKFKELVWSCNDIRFINGTIIKQGGWHLSYFGDSSFIKNKLENFAHQEYNSDNYTDKSKIEERISNGLDLFVRGTSNNIIKTPIFDNTYLPPFYETYLSSFYTK